MVSLGIAVFLAVVGFGLLFLVMRVLPSIPGKVWDRSWAARRRRAVDSLANRYGFQRCSPSQLEAVFELTPPETALRELRFGGLRGFDNVVCGSWRGLQMTAADYFRVTVDHAGGRTYWWYAVALTELGVALPYLEIDPVGALERPVEGLFRLEEKGSAALKRLVGKEPEPGPSEGEVRFESKEFSRAFQVTAADPQYAHELVDADMMAWLLGTGGRYSFAVLGSQVLTYTRHHGWKMAEFPLLLDALADFCARIPRPPR